MSEMRVANPTDSLGDKKESGGGSGRLGPVRPLTAETMTLVEGEGEPDEEGEECWGDSLASDLVQFGVGCKATDPCDGLAVSALVYEQGPDRQDPMLCLLLIEALSNCPVQVKHSFVIEQHDRDYKDKVCLTHCLGGGVPSSRMVGLHFSKWTELVTHGNCQPLPYITATKVNLCRRKDQGHPQTAHFSDWASLGSRLAQFAQIEALDQVLMLFSTHRNVFDGNDRNSLLTGILAGFSQCHWSLGPYLEYFLLNHVVMGGTSHKHKDFAPRPQLSSDNITSARDGGNYSFFSYMTKIGHHGVHNSTRLGGANVLDDLVYYGAKNGVIQCLHYAKARGYTDWARSGKALGLTVAHYAAQALHWECTDFLGDHGVDLVKVVDRKGFSCADYVLRGLMRKADAHNFIFCAEKWKFDRWEKDFTPNHDSLAHLAVSTGSEHVTRYLCFEVKANFTSRLNEDKLSALQLLKQSSEPWAEAIAKEILEKGTSD